MKIVYVGILSASLLATSALADPVPVKFAYPSAPNNALFAQGAQGWADDVNKAADGAIEIKIFAGGVIGDNSNMYDRITSGVTDIGLAVFGPVSSVFPLPTAGSRLWPPPPGPSRRPGARTGTPSPISRSPPGSRCGSG